MNTNSNKLYIITLNNYGQRFFYTDAEVPQWKDKPSLLRIRHSNTRYLALSKEWWNEPNNKKYFLNVFSPIADLQTYTRKRDAERAVFRLVKNSDPEMRIRLAHYLSVVEVDADAHFIYQGCD